jgi:hypothetical protein
VSDPSNACCSRFAVREHCPHPEIFFCDLVLTGRCNGQRQCNPCPDFKEQADDQN